MSCEPLLPRMYLLERYLMDGNILDFADSIAVLSYIMHE